LAGRDSAECDISGKSKISRFQEHARQFTAVRPFYTSFTLVGFLEVTMSERPDPLDPLPGDEPVPQTPDDIIDDEDDDYDDDEPLSDDETGPDPTKVI
jgi:hypothetical protein